MITAKLHAIVDRHTATTTGSRLAITAAAWARLGAPWPATRVVGRTTFGRREDQQTLVVRLRIGQHEGESTARVSHDGLGGYLLGVSRIDAPDGTEIQIVSAELREPPGYMTRVERFLRGNE